MFHAAPKLIRFSSWLRSCCWPGAVLELQDESGLLWACVITPISSCTVGMSVITQIQEGAAVIHSLPYFRGGLDATHGSTPLPPLCPDVTRTCCPFTEAVHTRTQGTLVTVTGQLIPSPGHGSQEVQVCNSWRAAAHFKQSNQDTPQLWKGILFMMDLTPKYLQGMWQPFRGSGIPSGVLVRKSSSSPCLKGCSLCYHEFHEDTSN